MKMQSIEGMRYFLTFIDDYSQKIWVYFMMYKSEALDFFREFKANVEMQNGRKIKTLQTDRGGEFTSNEFSHYCKINGIQRQLTTSYTPQQNCVAERKNRSIVEMAFVQTTIYLLNRSLTRVVQGMTPEKAWSGRKSQVNNLKIFGCTTYALIPNKTRHKLDDKSTKCILMGYSKETKGYKLYDPTNKKIIVNRDVVFDEELNTKTNEFSHARTMNMLRQNVKVMKSQRHQADHHKSTKLLSLIGQDREEKKNMKEWGSQAEAWKACKMKINPNVKNRRPNQMLQPQGRTRSQHQKAQRQQVNLVLMSSFINAYEPDSFEEACKNQIWIDAMQVEYNALLKNQTWQLVDLPQGKQGINSKWVYKTKFNADGTIDKHKARLVAKSFAQIEGIDYEEIFAPTAKMITIRILLSVAAQFGWKIHQMDVKTTFLNGDLEEEVYMQQPPSFVESGKEDRVCKLIKALYGLKQAPRAWYKNIDEYFKNNGFKRSDFDPSLYIKNQKAEIVIIIVYVDDLVIIVAYARELLKRFRMEECNPCKNPMEVVTKLSNEGESKPVDVTLYRQMIGSLIYLTTTRPDISFVVSVLSRFLNSPKEPHWYATKRVLRYIKGTLNFNILLEKNLDFKLTRFTNSDWARSIDDWKSTTSYSFNLGSRAVFWINKKQPTVVLSSIEAEYKSVVKGASEVIRIKRILDDMKNQQTQPTPI
eukprot:Gb_18985 [translate_table: standard]